MEELSKHGNLGRAAMKADMDRKTGKKYLEVGKLPSELKKPRTYSTRPDPFEDDWPWVEEKLRAAPELEAKTVFGALQERRPGRYQDGQLRTLQRRVKRWRATYGPDQEVFFAQEHRPGEAAQTDFTHAKELGVTIAGVAFVHLLCHVVLPYSNWQWLTVCLSESFLALQRGVQEALFRLGRRPKWHQTDNSSAATHQPQTGNRAFNDDYQALMDHLGLKPRTIGIGQKEQNGDVEAANGALKRWLNQHLLLRGSRDFDSVDEYERWLWDLLEKRNTLRSERLNQELAVMEPVNASRLAEFRELDVRVTRNSTIRVLYNTYSVPSRLRDELIRVRIYESKLEVWYGGNKQFETERLRGRFGHRINYRHIIWSLIRKPGAFARYRYREDLFPSLTFRRAYDLLHEQQPDVRGDLEYLRILHLSAATMQSEVEAALSCLLEVKQVPSYAEVRSLVIVDESAPPPPMECFEVDLGDYDDLLEADLGDYDELLDEGDLDQGKEKAS